MTFPPRLLTLVGVALLGLALAADARAADVPKYAIAANVNDPGIDPSRGKNLVWLAPETRRVGSLLVILPYGAMNNLTTNFQEIGAEGGRLGYHTIVLAYKNEVPIAAAAGCGNGADPSSAPQDCAFKARMEIFDGLDESSVINVDRANSIENRLTKVLQHLAATSPPEEGWSQFLDAGGTQPKWSETVIAGGSLGAGQAALIGMLHQVRRVSLFAGWTDAAHHWLTDPATPSDRYFALIHARDQFFARTCDSYLTLGMAAACPLPDFSLPPANALLVENRDPPFGSHLLVFNLEFAPNQPAVPDPYHASTIRDGYIAKEPDGKPSQKLLNAWRSVLGDDTDDDGITNITDNCPGTGNGGQADADGDGSGDACDATPQGTTPPAITVPAHITVNATGPGGATVRYTVTATDDLPPAPSPVCTPLAGNHFTIGDTSVACTAIDAGGNTANANFLVTVLGAKEQLVNLIRKVIDATSLPAASKMQLTASLQSLAAGFEPSKPLQRAVACLTLRAFTTRLPFVAPPAQRAEWTADANRIRAVLAC
jgi:hypothetical protein